MDMGRTAVNVMGNCIATVVVARWEGVFDDARMRRSRPSRAPGRRDVGLRSSARRSARRRRGSRGLVRSRSRRLDRAALDITDAGARGPAMQRVWRPAVIINCAGDNAVDAGEDHPVEALQANAFAVRALARLRARARRRPRALQQRLRVRRGLETAHTEEDPLEPASVYATSKLLGEWFAADAPQAYVLRVESLFGRAPGGPPAERQRRRRFVNGLRSAATPKVFEDRTVSPTYVLDAAWATRELIERRAPFGLYHCVNSGACTWLEFAEEAARLLGVEPRVDPVRVADVPLRADPPAVLRAVEREAEGGRNRDADLARRAQRYVATCR